MSSKPLVIQFLPDPVQYNPNQPRDRETAKRIRSHIAGNLRRKKLQVLLNPTSVPTTLNTPHVPASVGNNFCNCVVLQTTPQPHSKEDAKSKALQKQRAIADSYKICQRCHKVQFLELSWLGQLKAARQRIPSVTPFLESEFDPFESLPELVHYKQSPQAKRLMNEFKAHLIVYMPYEVLRNNVLSAAATTPALFMGLLYSSCSHLEAVREGGESQLSIAIKQEAMRQINIRLDDPEQRNTTETISSIGYLASGVMAIGGPNVLAETATHEAGMARIWSEGLGGIVPENCALSSTLILILVVHQMSRAATLAHPIDRTFILGFCDYTQYYPPSSFLPESPVFCPRDDFYTVKTSKHCSVYTLQILRGLKQLVDFLIEDDMTLPTKGGRFKYELFRREMKGLPSASVFSSLVGVRSDYIYECLRIVGMMLIHCVDTRTSFKHIPSRFVNSLKLALQKTDIGGYWGSMSGLFFFVAMVGSAAAMQTQHHGFMGTILARADHEITYGQSVYEGATIAAWRMQRMHVVLLERWKDNCGKGLGFNPLDSGVAEGEGDGSFWIGKEEDL